MPAESTWRWEKMSSPQGRGITGHRTTAQPASPWPSTPCWSPAHRRAQLRAEDAYTLGVRSRSFVRAIPILLVLLAATGALLGYDASQSDTIANGITVGGVNIGGLNAAQ